MNLRLGSVAIVVGALVGLSVVSRSSEPAAIRSDPAPFELGSSTALQGTTTELARQTPRRRPLTADPGRAGVAAYARGQYDDALSFFLDAITEDPDDAELHNNLGQTLVRLGRSREAVEHLETARALDPTKWLYHTNLAGALGDLNDWDRAVRTYQVAARMAPSEPSVHYELGRALHARGNDRQAVTAYRTALSLAPAEPGPHLALGMSFEALRQWDDALSSYRRYLELTPDGSRSDALRLHVEAISTNRGTNPVGG